MLGDLAKTLGPRTPIDRARNEIQKSQLLRTAMKIRLERQLELMVQLSESTYKGALRINLAAQQLPNRLAASKDTMVPRYSERTVNDLSSEGISRLALMRCPIHDVLLIPGYAEMYGTDHEYVPLRCSNSECTVIAKLTNGNSVELLTSVNRLSNNR